MPKLFVKDFDVDSKVPWAYILMCNCPVEIIHYRPSDRTHVQLNHSKVLPFLHDDDLSVWGRNAVLIYIAERYGDFAYYSKGIEEKAKINSILYWAATTLNRAVIRNYVQPQLSDPVHKLPGNDNQHLITHGLQNIKEQLDILEHQYFEKNPFMTGDKETIADIHVAVILLELGRFNFDFSSWPKTNAWLSGIGAKIKKVLPLS